MKAPTTALAFLLSTSSSITDAQCIRGGVKKHAENQQQQLQQTEHAKSIDIQDVECSAKAILPLIQDNPHFAKALTALTNNNSSKSSSSSVHAAIDQLCSDHQHEQNNNNRSLQTAAAEVPFSHVTARGRQFDKNYFDGGTEWNSGEASKSSASRIEAVSDALASQQLAWPSYIVNFDDTNSCQLRTAMCCFTKAHKTESQTVHNINDVFPSIPNADVCMVDLSNSPQAGHVKNGKTYYSDGRKVAEETNDAYCTGFYWSADASDVSNKYRANTLFHLSMLDAFYNKNLVGGVPGAPMCGCVEQMPVVSHAQCMEPVQARRLSVSNTGDDGEERLLITTSITVEPCAGGNSLVDAYAADSANSAAEAESLSKIIAGSCVDAIDADLTPQGYKRGTAWWYADDDKWIPVLGEKDLYHPEMSAADFQAAFDASSTKTIRRICKSCAPTHRDIYYKRITAVPSSLDLLTMLKSSFTSTNNVLGTDFEMYSKDSKDGSITTWNYCDYSETIGFPFECGPDDAVKKQYTTSTSSTYAKHYAFYIEK